MKNKELIHKLLNIVAFASLMENEGGIVDKSPNYILEKFQRFCESPYLDNWKTGLDKKNRDKVRKWANKWFTNKQKLKAKEPMPTGGFVSSVGAIEGMVAKDMVGGLLKEVMNAKYNLKDEGGDEDGK